MRTLTALAPLLASLALAQEPPPPPPPLPPAGAPAPVTAPTSANPLLDETVQEDPGGRIRWGIDGRLGWHAPTPAFTLGAEARAGYQFTQLFAVYGLLGAGFGLGLGIDPRASGVATSVTGLSWWQAGVIAELFFGDVFYLGLGPLAGGSTLVTGFFESYADGSSAATGITASGPAFAIDLRAGFGLGRKNPLTFRRGGFNIGLDFALWFHPGSAINQQITAPDGTTSNRTFSGLAVNLIPMLTLGYDAR